jgi:pimeloyl-ACP methyl ester carboxylesterase
MRAAFEVYRRAGARGRAMAEIRCPVLILHGAKDLVLPRFEPAFAARCLSSSDVTLRIYRRSAH